MAPIPTQRVRRIDVGDVVVINIADFDSRLHQEMTPEDLAAYQPPAPPAAATAPIAPASATEPPVPAEDLRQDGPTIEDFVAAGYSQEVYPPVGYAAKDSAGLEAYRALVASMTTVNAQAAIAIVEGAETPAGLDRLEAAEQAHPNHAGGRVSVLRAITERRAALKAKE